MPCPCKALPRLLQLRALHIHVSQGGPATACGLGVDSISLVSFEPPCAKLSFKSFNDVVTMRRRATKHMLHILNKIRKGTRTHKDNDLTTPHHI